LQVWFPHHSIERVDAVDGGLSGASVWCVTLREMQRRTRWALKGWPDQQRAVRLAEIHRVVQTARQQGCDAIPRPRTLEQSKESWCVDAGWVWECAAWLEGGPPDLQSQLRQSVSQMARWDARFVESIRHLASASGTPMTLVDRQRRIVGLRRKLEHFLTPNWLGFESPPSHAAHWTDPAESLQNLRAAIGVLNQAWRKMAPRFQRELQAWADVRFPLQYVARDVHFGNSLFLDSQLVGFVDFDAVRVDTAAADLSRLVGSVLMQRGADCRPDEIWHWVLAEYRAIRSFSDQEEALARWLAEINPLLNLANWVIWLAVEGRDFGGSWEEAFSRLRQWSIVVAQQTGVTPDGPGW
jgi:hypothetical protein